MVRCHRSIESNQLKLLEIKQASRQVYVPLVLDLIELNLQIDVVLLLNVDNKVDADYCHEAEEHSEHDCQVQIQDLGALLLKEQVLARRDVRVAAAVGGGH